MPVADAWFFNDAYYMTDRQEESNNSKSGDIAAPSCRAAQEVNGLLQSNKDSMDPLRAIFPFPVAMLPPTGSRIYIEQIYLIFKHESFEEVLTSMSTIFLPINSYSGIYPCTVNL